LKVLQLSYRLPFPPKDGGALGLLRILEGYEHIADEFHFLGVRTPKHYVSNLDLKKYTEKHPHVAFTWVDINQNPNYWGAGLSFFTKKSYHGIRLIDSTLLKAIQSILHNHEFDLIHFDGPFWVHYIKEIKALSKAKLVFRAHNIEHQIWKRLSEEDSSFLKRIYLRNQWPKIELEEREMANSVDIILPISSIDDLWFSSVSQTTRFILEAGLPLHQYSLGNRGPNNKWCFLASLEWLPNIQGLERFLSEIWPEIHRKFPNISFSVAGRRMPESWKNRNISGVHFVGEIESVTDFYKEYGWLIVPLWSGSGVRIKMIEAMAMGMPCISTTVGAEGLGVSHNKDFLEANTLQDWLEVAASSEHNSNLGDIISQHSREFVFKHYDNRVIFEKWHQFFLQFCR
jgi:glycosyltransferase involved in cell wall biosynthesis